MPAHPFMNNAGSGALFYVVPEPTAHAVGSHKCRPSGSSQCRLWNCPTQANTGLEWATRLFPSTQTNTGLEWATRRRPRNDNPKVSAAWQDAVTTIGEDFCNAG